MTKHADKRNVKDLHSIRDDQLPSWRDVGGICAIHGVPDSCADTLSSPSANHLNFSKFIFELLSSGIAYTFNYFRL